MKTIKNGFTLIELLIVVSIIGLLASVLMVRISSIDKSARDTARRKSDLNQYRIAMENYAARNNGAYPTVTLPIGSSCPGTVYAAQDNLCYLLTNAGIVTACPTDPLDDGSRISTSYYYRYRCNTSSTNYLFYSLLENTKYYYLCSNGMAGESTTEPSPVSTCQWDPSK